MAEKIETVRMKKPLTRNDNICPVFGIISRMSINVLPTYADIMNYFLSVRKEFSDGHAKKATINETTWKISVDLETIWHRASIPVISRQQIIAKIRDYHDKYRSLLKPFEQRSKDKESQFLNKVENFKIDSNRIFDIASCKCKDFSTCVCEKNCKVLPIEIIFLADQRTERKMAIGNVDIKKTKQQQKKLKRKLADELRFYKCESITNAETLKSHPDCSLEDDCNDVTLGDLDEVKSPKEIVMKMLTS
ncbi:uncharacterized protein LOC136089092 [Hydra vulgaris]|uniref:Uncharacterized protein LOC136089092 n=1 Tax=Hydra vulgaris TaxID=6087 RepID=A0ABM4D997_HYDVU